MPVKKKAKNGVKVRFRLYLCSVSKANVFVLQNKPLDAVKGGSKASSSQTSRAVSVSSNGTGTKGKGKGRKK